MVSSEFIAPNILLSSKSPRVLHSPGHPLHQSRQRSRLCDRVLHGSKRFSVTNGDVDRLQGTDTHGAFGEVGVGINQDFELAEHPDQQVCKVPVNDSREVGPCALREV